MRRTIVYITLLCFASLPLAAQSTLDTVLASIERNSRELGAEKQRINTAKAGYKTGLTLNDPAVGMDYMKGYPATAGNQTDLTVTQGFDFPTVYGIRKKIASQRTEQAGFEAQRSRQEILLDAKLVAMHIIYLNKRETILRKRLQDADSFYTDYQRKYDLKDATILDLNKAKLQQANIRVDMQQLQAERIQYLRQLTAFNGGEAISFTDTVYAIVPDLPAFDTLEQAIEAIDPTLLLLERQKAAGETEIRLSKALWLPKLEAGYHYQRILGQRFHGGRVGFSIPLWENRNKVRFRQQQAVYFSQQIDAHRVEHYNHVKELYDKYTQLKESKESYHSALQQLAPPELLEKSLRAGQITTLEYYMELSIYYESQDRYLTLESELQKTGAMLMKHLL